ncbi:MAG: DUF3616 domain-containing protein [Betaproteobacteria bacterium]|nr:DUF3616 domain-containing protein [Betaproteobacteria bacterium]
MSRLPAFAFATLLALPNQASASGNVTLDYAGPCDASAAVALDAGHFVVGNDERNRLHIYRTGQPKPVGTLDLDAFLATAPDEESDIEAAARVGSRIYWITSHGRNAKGRFQGTRHRFFATEVLPGSPPALHPIGHPYSGLLADMLAAGSLAGYGLAAAARRAAEADGGFNIEGLAARPDGTLLIGLRNPLPHGRALVIPLLNPERLIAGGRARFGRPFELELDQRGIRSIDRVGDTYFIVAGPTADRGTFAIYRWSGKADDPARLAAGVNLGTLRPEALFAIPESDRLLILSDDGGIRLDGIECKKRNAQEQAFRSLILEIEP